MTLSATYMDFHGAPAADNSEAFVQESGRMYALAHCVLLLPDLGSPMCLC